MSTNRCPANTGTTNLFLWIGGELYMSVCASVCWFACGHLHAVPLPQLVLMSSPPPLSHCFSPQDPYQITCKLGRGKYSEVFEGYDVRDPQNHKKIVIKVLKVRAFACRT